MRCQKVCRVICCARGDKTPRTNAQMHRKEDKYLKFWEKKL